MAVYILRPNGVGHYNTGWTITPTSPVFTYWENVDDDDQDGDVTCIYTDAPRPFTVELSDFSAGSFVRPCRIPNVSVVATVRPTIALPTRFRIRLRYLGYDYDSEILTVSSASYVEVVVNYPQMPNGDSWNAVRLSDLELGLVYIDGEELRCTKLELQVTTEPYPYHTLAPTDIGTYQDWSVHPSTGPAAMAVQLFDGDESYIASDTTWSSMDSVNSYDLRGCFGFSAVNVWAVGLSGTVLQYDGTRWVKKLAPTALPTTKHLYGVWGDSASALWVVGQLGTILFYDGTDWFAQASGTLEDLMAVWGDSDTDVWAVGANGTALHFNGAVWSSVATGTIESINSISGVATNDIWAVGSAGLLLHWNGAVWALTAPAVPDALLGVSMVAAGDAWAVGATGTLLYWDGMVWTALVVPAITSTLFAVWGSSSTNFVAVGANGTIVLWDGATWTTLSTVTTKTLYSLWGFTQYQIFVVGEDDTILLHPDMVWWPKSTFVIDDLPAVLVPAVIDRVSAGVLVKNQSEISEGSCAVVLRSGGVDYFGATGQDGQVVPLDSHWHVLDTYWLNDPAVAWPSGAVGATPWLAAQINSLEVGLLNLGGDLRCTALAVEVWLKHAPLGTTTLVPVANGYYHTAALANRIPTLFPAWAAWLCVQDDPPDYGVSYIQGDATAAGTPLYGTFEIAAFAALPATEQIYCLQHRTWVKLGSTDYAVVAPAFRLNGETYFGRPYRVDHTGASWLALRTPFFTSPFSSKGWTEAEVNAPLEIGVVILEGDLLVTNVNVEVETAPLLVIPAPGIPDPLDLQLTQAATDLMTRSLLDGTIYAVTEFAVGTDGFLLATPWQISAVDPLAVALGAEVYRASIDRLTLDRVVPPGTTSTVQYWCRVPRDVVRDAIGELGLYATILWSPVPGETGTSFLFALQHFSCQSFHSRATQLFVVSITYP
jgi:hypothetical protein